MLRTILPFLLIFAGILLALFVLKKDTANRKKALKPKYQDIPINNKEDLNLTDYLISINDLCGITRDEDIKNILERIRHSLREIHGLMLSDKSIENSIENFADKYLPIIIESIIKFNKMPTQNIEIYNKTKNDVINTLEMFNKALEQIMNKYAEAQAQGIMVDNDTIQSLLKMNGDLKNESIMK